MSAPTTMQWIRQAAQRIATGSARLATHLAARALHAGRKVWRAAAGWLGEASGVGWLLRLAVLLTVAAVLRKIIMAVIVGVYARVASGAAPWLLWGTAGLWVVAAYRCGKDDWKPKQPATAEPPTTEPKPDSEQPADTPEAQPEPAVEQTPAGPLLPNLLDLRVSLAKVGTPHAHLAVLAADIGTTPERVREALDRWEIPVEAVRMQGRGTSTGVKGGAAAHPALAPGPDVVAVVAAGQPANNDNNNAFTTVPDEKNPVRTHVVWRDQETEP
ncbi:hypothetical protein [Streptomyces kebangsaanensis]|uniref:hypothetical protein n=1 Tax=Streptomyces kebangsaanensis TaxID=864058 RepID=UPI00093B4F9C|nr:hypothetical protein [Streptomyces kebangsaanensis]